MRRVVEKSGILKYSYMFYGHMEQEKKKEVIEGGKGVERS